MPERDSPRPRFTPAASGPRSALLALCLAGCGSAGGGSPAGTGGIRDIADRCPLLIDCYEFGGFDGCPDPVVEFAVGSAEVPAAAMRLIDELADEIVRTPSLVKLRLVGCSRPGEPESLGEDRAANVRIELERRGIAASALEIEGRVSGGQDGWVALEVIDCNGAPPPVMVLPPEDSPPAP